MTTKNNTEEEKKDDEVDFDLGEYTDDSAPKAKPRIHNFADASCQGCEG